MARYQFSIMGLSLFLVLSLPFVRHLLESSMVGTMLVQIPLLVVSGFLCAMGLTSKWSKITQSFNENGIPGILLVVFIVSYWSLPRAIDAALNEPLMELMKYASLPLLVGVPLYESWKLLGPISKSFIWANLISMIFVMSWLYLASPVRLCNNYLVTAQQQLGKAFLYIGFALCLYFIIRLFTGKSVKYFIHGKSNRQA
ncbi:hypothetical protein [Fredinandcohnia quinoae]|uniref:Transmembrane protein n=1 Tax=Fredinandcohnia quinoae TaxID=2918902 RepID=A0AAW5DYZ6_9BACI|nr:hypothetical protein [Fredinandcohnia sp. SECRCQ15]MCH1625862.1 hypothetical protein [Fredinandcohnia sp. SECRCQ15]